MDLGARIRLKFKIIKYSYIDILNFERSSEIVFPKTPTSSFMLYGSSPLLRKRKSLLLSTRSQYMTARILSFSLFGLKHEARNIDEDKKLKRRQKDYNTRTYVISHVLNLFYLLF